MWRIDFSFSSGLALALGSLRAAHSSSVARCSSEGPLLLTSSVNSAHGPEGQDLVKSMSFICKLT